jgi:hypothetical protein
MTSTNAKSDERDGRSDFDFFIGRWKIRNRRLRERLKASTDWEEFEGTTVARTLLGGLGNLDECVMERAAGQLRGMTVRLYDPATRQWSLYWADNVKAGILQTPMIGRFEGGRGEFYSQEPFEGRHIFCRFIWSEITQASCRWEQAYSPDGGKTWETNWIMDFVRTE